MWCNRGSAETRQVIKSAKGRRNPQDRQQHTGISYHGDRTGDKADVADSAVPNPCSSHRNQGMGRKQVRAGKGGGNIGDEDESGDRKPKQLKKRSFTFVFKFSYLCI